MAVVNKFVNGVDECVGDCLKGLVLGDSRLLFHPHNPRVVLRRDLDELKEGGKVAIVSFGGSGHEPFCAGFVGPNGLSAAVCGELFASPPAAHIADGLAACYSPAGVLLISNNYTGDRLNCGMAVERLKAEHPDRELRIDLVYVDDDVALEDPQDRSSSTVGGRGLAGCVIALHCAGVWAEAEKWEFEQLRAEVRRLIANTATIGVSLNACALLGRERMFEMPAGELEFGLGIHGEPGSERRPIEPVRELVDVVLSRLVGCRRLFPLNPTDSPPLILLLNNLGGCTNLELLIVQGAAIEWLQERGFRVARVISGTLTSSLDGHGFSLTLVKCEDSRWLRAVDTPSIISSQWKATRPLVSAGNGEVLTSPPPPSVQQLHVPVDQLGVQVSIATAHTIKQAFVKACERVMEVEGRTADAVEGPSISAAARTCVDFAEDGKFNFARPAAFCRELAALLEQTAGGEGGAAYSRFFLAAADAFNESFDGHQLKRALNAGLEAVEGAVGSTPTSSALIDVLRATVEHAASDWTTMIDAAKKVAAAGVSAPAGTPTDVPRKDEAARLFAAWFEAAVREAERRENVESLCSAFNEYAK